MRKKTAYVEEEIDFLYNFKLLPSVLVAVLRVTLGPKYLSLKLLISLYTCIISWSDSIFIKVNPSIFDLIYFCKSSRLIESHPSINIPSNFSLAFSSTIHNLGFTFDSLFSLIPEIKYVADSSFFHLCRIKQLKLFLHNAIFKLLFSFLIPL